MIRIEFPNYTYIEITGGRNTVTPRCTCGWRGKEARYDSGGAGLEPVVMAQIDKQLEDHRGNAHPANNQR